MVGMVDYIVFNKEKPRPEDHVSYEGAAGGTSGTVIRRMRVKQHAGRPEPEHHAMSSTYRDMTGCQRARSQVAATNEVRFAKDADTESTTTARSEARSSTSKIS